MNVGGEKTRSLPVIKSESIYINVVVVVPGHLQGVCLALPFAKAEHNAGIEITVHNQSIAEADRDIDRGQEQRGEGERQRC